MDVMKETTFKRLVDNILRAPLDIMDIIKSTIIMPIKIAAADPLANAAVEDWAASH